MNAPRRPIRLIDEPEADTDSVPVLDASGALEVLRTANTIAVVGASTNTWRPSHMVMRYLMGQGYTCVPVTPVSTEVLGRRSYGSLDAAVAAAGGPFDIVDVFRRAEHAPDIARAAVALGCGTLWLQEGVISVEAARIAHDGGMRVVMDRCTAIDHRRLRSISGQT